MTTTVCHNRWSKQRVSIEVCRWHVQAGDKICLKKLDSGGKVLKCEVAREIMDGEKNEI